MAKSGDITEEEAMRILNISAETLRNYRSNGTILETRRVLGDDNKVKVLLDRANVNYYACYQQKQTEVERMGDFFAKQREKYRDEKKEVSK